MYSFPEGRNSLINRRCPNVQLITNLAKTYRVSDSPEQAINVFRKHGKDRKDRTYFYEWGTAEGIAGNQALSVLLDAYSLTDWNFQVPPDNRRAMYSLAGLSVAFLNLYNDFNNSIFLNARAASCTLGLTLNLNSRTRDNFIQGLKESEQGGAPKMDINEAFNNVEQGVSVAKDYVLFDETLTKCVPSVEKLTFEGFKKLIRRGVARQGK